MRHIIESHGMHPAMHALIVVPPTLVLLVVLPNTVINVGLLEAPLPPPHAPAPPPAPRAILT